jgi:hypothetical protein
MTTIPLILALLAADRPQARSMALAEAQVDFVALTRTVHDLEQVLPRRQAMLIRQLGCEHADCRTMAREELELMDSGAHVALAWGTHARDPEVRATCRRLLDRLYRCSTCGGRGEVDLNAGRKTYGMPAFTYVEQCSTCHGSGDPRFRVEYVDVGHNDYVAVRVPDESLFEKQR